MGNFYLQPPPTWITTASKLAGANTFVTSFKGYIDPPAPSTVNFDAGKGKNDTCHREKSTNDMRYAFAFTYRSGGRSHRARKSVCDPSLNRDYPTYAVISHDKVEFRAGNALTTIVPTVPRTCEWTGGVYAFNYIAHIYIYVHTDIAVEGLAVS